MSTYKPAKGQPGSRADKLTDNERRFLTALATYRTAIGVTPGGMIAAGKLPADSSPQGLHQTAASLVHKGLVERNPTVRITHYLITTAGREALR